MRVVKILPLVPLLFTVPDTEHENNKRVSNSPAATSTEAPQVSKGDTVTINGLTQEQVKALDYMEAFLKKYTSNGKLNYGTIYRLVEGLKQDYKTVNEEGKTMSGFEGLAARAYPNNLLKSTYYKVQKEIERRAREEMTCDFIDFGVDQKTEEKVDNAPIENYVTKPELLEYRRNSYIFKRIIERDLPSGKKIAFKDGVNLDAVKFIKEGKKSLPPGAEVVDASKTAKD